jgi:Protein of unknown function (DUF3298)
VTTRNSLLALVGAIVVVGTAACGNSRSSKPGPLSETVTTPPATSTSSAPSPSSTPIIMTTASSACSDLGGSVGAGNLCTFHTETPGYTIDMKFPFDYPDQRALSDLLTRERDQFVEGVTKPPQPPQPKALDITPTTYRSATGNGTESLVLEEYADYGGAHPVTLYNALNYDLGKQAPITYDTLFKPGTDPVAVLDPIVKAAFEKLLEGAPLDENINGAKTYRNFALTDDAVIFFIGQGEWAFEAAGPQQFSIPRSELASILA